MIGFTEAQWLVTVIFVVTGGWYLTDAVRLLVTPDGERSEAVGAGFHVLTSAAMVAMFWPWGAAVSPILQITVFTAGAAWFAGWLLLTPAGRGPSPALDGMPEEVEPPWPNAGGSWLVSGAYHVAMMAAMVWMAIAMATVSVGGDAGGSASGLSTAGVSTAGISMRGMSMGAAPGVGGVTVVRPTWMSSICIVLGAGFIVAAASYVRAIVRRRSMGRVASTPVAVHDGIGAAMAVGMAVSLWQLA